MDRTRNDIVFIDPSVPYPEQLAAGVAPGVEVVVLDPYIDGVTQISRVLSGRRGLKALHLVSHGAPGKLLLGNVEVSSTTLVRYTDDLHDWSEALAPGATLLIYGCETASGADGESFITKIGQLTGAAIAATATRTGSAALGGDWVLEHRTGSPSHGLAFVPGLLRDYPGVLGDIWLRGAYIDLPIDGTGATQGQFMLTDHSAGGQYLGMDFWKWGTPIYNTSIAVEGAIRRNGAGWLVSPTVTDLSSDLMNQATISGTPFAGLDFLRVVSFGDDDRIVTITDTLTNTGGTALGRVATLDNTDPDQGLNPGLGSSYNTDNDVVSAVAEGDLVIASVSRGAYPDGLTLGFGSPQATRAVSAFGFSNTDPYVALEPHTDPDGSSGDIGINIAFDYGTLDPGQSVTSTWYMVFGDSTSEAIATYQAATVGIDPGAFPVLENSPAGTLVGTATGHGTAPLTYAISGGNSDPDGDTEPAFAIDATTGAITVNDGGDLDFEVTTRFDLEVTVTNADGLTGSGPIRIDLGNLDEPGNDRPEAQDALFSLPENRPPGTPVGTVLATDLDAGDTLAYAITAGNVDPNGNSQAAFAIDPANGAITVNDSGDLDFETTPSFLLDVAVTDTGGLAATATITVNLTDNLERIGTAGDDDLAGAAGDDLLDGRAGNDTLRGGAGNDTLIGGTGIDWVIEAGGGDLTLTDTELTGAGADSLSGIERASLTGGPGNDTLDASGFTRGTVVLDGGAGDDLLIGPATAGTWHPFDGLFYANRFTGGDGNDTFTGGAGIDAIDEQGDLDFTLGAHQLTGRGLDSFVSMEIARLTGGPGDNRLDVSTFTGSLTILDGGDGNDTLVGGAARDRVQARGDTDFRLTDTELSGRGADSLTGMDRAWLGGGRHDNVIDVSAFTGARATLSGGGGSDTLIGRTGLIDRVSARGDVDFILTDTHLTGRGADSLTDIDEGALIGGAADNILDVSAFTGSLAILEGGGGDDTLIGRADGVDRVRARGDVDFTLTDGQLTGLGTDTLTHIDQALLIGDGSDNRLDASAFTRGPVFLYGESGNDLLSGGSGNDHLDGGDGDDTLRGGGGIDRVEARGDTDFTLYPTQLIGLGTDTIEAVEEAHLCGGPGDNTLDASRFTGGLVILEGAGGDDTLIGRAGAIDRVRAVGDVDFTLTDDRLTGLGSDTFVDIDEVQLIGSSGASTFDASAFTRGPVMLSAGSGDDTLRGGSADDRIHGGVGDDVLDGGDGDDSLVGDTGDDLLDGGTGHDTLRGGAGTDTASYAAASGDVSVDLAIGGVSGAAGNDTLIGIENLIGSAFDDVLIGDRNANTLRGAAGNDTLTGGRGPDAFQFVTTGDGVDSITDFVSGRDRIEVVSANFGGLPLGALDPSRFLAPGAPPASGDAVFIYDATTGSLGFDADGAGPGSAAQVATLTGPRLLLASDIQLVA